MKVSKIRHEYLCGVLVGFWCYVLLYNHYRITPLLSRIFGGWTVENVQKTSLISYAISFDVGTELFITCKILLLVGT